MKFFIPAAQSDAEADVVLEAIAKFNSLPLPERRIFRLSFKHNGVRYDVEVGQPAPDYFRAGGPVVAILGNDPICVCLADRGVLRGSPIYVGKNSVLSMEYFEYDANHLRGET
ncbi:hypothetical protein [Parvibaculum sp. MBR-TMA-1.3b-4.2]|jgi:hypothetical protein